MSKKLLFSTFLFLTISGFSQNVMNVDSVRVLPANPTVNDSVFLHIYWHCSYGCGLQMAPSVVNSGTTHTATACYVVGPITVLTSGDDSVFLFQGPAGVHTVAWQVIQNSSQSTSCDYTHAQNQVQVNVVPTGVPEFGNIPGLEIAEQQFLCNTDGTFRVYSSTGQLIYESIAVPGKRIAIRAHAGQMYFATLTSNTGEVTTIKFIMEE
jgi:hypothetical protein